MTQRDARAVQPRPAASANAGAVAVRALLQVDARIGQDSPSQFAAALLQQLIEVTGAWAGNIEVDRDDSRGTVTLATIGSIEHLMPDELVQRQLPVSRPWSGRIALAAPLTPWTQALVQLTAERLGLTLENQRLFEADLRRQTWLTFLAEVSELLAQSLDIKLTMALIPRVVVPRLGHWSAVYVADELTAAAHVDETALPRLLEVLDSERGHPAFRATTTTALPAPLDGYAVPLIARAQWLGTLVIGRHPRQRDPDELTIAEDVARRAALALDNARAHEDRRRVAEALQRALLPPSLPEIAGLGLAAEYVPATDGVDVGGDFYDVILLPDGRCLLMVGDVSGKGAPAASVTGLVREVFRALVRDGRSPESVLSTVNEILFERRERHCTLALATVGRRGPGGRVEVSIHLAGHDRPLLVHHNGGVTTAGAWGTALGLLDEVTCPQTTVTLDPGDSLIFYTDGVTDRRRGNDFYGLERLKAAAGQVAGYPADAMATRLRAAALDFSNEPQRDDMAIVVLRNEN